MHVGGRQTLRKTRPCLLRIGCTDTSGPTELLPCFACLLIGSDGIRFAAPQPLRASFREVRKANRAPARKIRGSRHGRQARFALAQVHTRITHQRQAWQWNLAHELCAAYDTIFLEDLELHGMQALWGRKVAALGFGRFVQILHQAAEKHGTHIHHIDRFVACVCDGRAAPA